MSTFSPRRQPLSLVHNKSNSFHASTAGSGSPGSSSSSSSKLGKQHTSPKASLETSREGRASLSLSFMPFEPYRIPATATTSTSDSSAGSRVRARATTVSAAASTSAAVDALNRHSTSTTILKSPPRTVAALGPARRTRSKTLSKSQSHATTSSSVQQARTRQAALAQDADGNNRRMSYSFVESDNLQRTLDLLEQHAEEQGRRLSLSSSSNGPNSATDTSTAMLSAPSMQRSPVTPMPNANAHTAHYPSSHGWANGFQSSNFSPPTLLPPYMPAPPDLLELVYPSSTSPNSLSSSTSSTQSSTASQAVLTPQVEQLSNLISDLSLFLPRADSLSSDQLQAIQTAVDSILGKTPAYQISPPPVQQQQQQSSLGDAIQLRNDIMSNFFADDMPTLYVGGAGHASHLPSASLHNAPSSTFHPASQTLYDPSTPRDDVDMLDMSIPKSNHFSAHSTKETQLNQQQQQRQGGILQVQHNPPPYEARINFSSLDYDLGLVPPRW